MIKKFFLFHAAIIYSLPYLAFSKETSQQSYECNCLLKDKNHQEKIKLCTKPNGKSLVYLREGQHPLEGEYECLCKSYLNGKEFFKIFIHDPLKENNEFSDEIYQQGKKSSLSTLENDNSDEAEEENYSGALENDNSDEAEEENYSDSLENDDSDEAEEENYSGTLENDNSDEAEEESHSDSSENDDSDEAEENEIHTKKTQYSFSHLNKKNQLNTDNEQHSSRNGKISQNNQNNNNAKEKKNPIEKLFGRMAEGVLTKAFNTAIGEDGRNQNIFKGVFSE